MNNLAASGGEYAPKGLNLDTEWKSSVVIYSSLPRRFQLQWKPPILEPIQTVPRVEEAKSKKSDALKACGRVSASPLSLLFDVDQPKT